MRATILVAAVLLAACVQTKVDRLTPTQKYAPVPPESVRVFLNEQEVVNGHYEYETVAIVYGSGNHFWTDEAQMSRKLREEAGKQGANGVILGEMKEPGFLQSERKSRVVAIRWWPRKEPDYAVRGGSGPGSLGDWGQDQATSPPPCTEGPRCRTTDSCTRNSSARTGRTCTAT